MAPIANSPFLEYLIVFLKKQNLKEFIICTGHGGESIRGYFGDGKKLGLSIQYTIEEELLGTGGAIKLTERLIDSDHFLVVNGDTYFEVDIITLLNFHKSNAGIGTLALLPKEDTGRYGRVLCDSTGRIKSFQEKSEERKSGYINGGYYVFRKELFQHIKINSICSLEREILPSLIRGGLYGFPFDRYFIDIGVPEDYDKAKIELPLRGSL